MTDPAEPVDRVGSANPATTVRPTRPVGPAVFSGRRLCLLLIVAGLVLGAAAVAFWAWPDAEPAAAPTTPTTPRTPEATPDPTPSQTAATGPTPTDAPTDAPTDPADTSAPADREDVVLAMTTEYTADAYRFAYLGTGEQERQPYAFLAFGPGPDGPRVRVVLGEPYELPDGRWLQLTGIGDDESAAFTITTARPE